MTRSSSESNHEIELDDLQEAPPPQNVNDEFTQVVQRVNGTEISNDVSRNGPWNLLLQRILPENLMKEPLLKNWVERCEESVQNLLANVSKRKEIVSFVESSLQKVGVLPRHFLFFVGKPKHTEALANVIVIVEKGKRMSMVRGNKKMTMKGVISYFFAKSNSKLEFGFSTGLFVKFRLMFPSKVLVRMIQEFLKEDPAVSPITFMYQCFHEYGAVLPTPYVIRDFIFAQVMSPNLEMVTKWEIHQWTDEVALRHAAQSVFVLFAKAHVLGYFVRLVLPLYISKLEDYPEFMEKRTFMGHLLVEATRFAGNQFYHDLRGRLRHVLKLEKDPKHYMPYFLDMLLKAEFPPLLMLMARVIWCVGRKLYGTNIEASFYIVSKFLLSVPLRLEASAERCIENNPDLSKKYECIAKLLLFEANNPTMSSWVVPYKRVIACLMESSTRMTHRETGLSSDLEKAAFENLCAIFVTCSQMLLDIEENTELPEHWVTPLEVTMNDIFKEVDKLQAPVPEMGVFIQLSRRKRTAWLKKHGVQESQVPGIVIPWSEIEPLKKPTKKLPTDGSVLRIRRKRKTRDEDGASEAMSESQPKRVRKQETPESSALISESGRRNQHKVTSSEASD